MNRAATRSRTLRAGSRRLRAMAVLAACIFSGSASAAYVDEVIADSPVAYWRFEETAGTTAADSAGAYDGTYLNGVTLGQGGAFAGSLAAAFDGVDDYISIGSGPWGGTELTVEAWFNLGHATDNFEAIVSSTGFRFVHLQLQQTTGNPGMIAIYTDWGYIGFDALDDALTGWHHVVLSLASGDSRLYLDGDLVDSSTAGFGQVLTADSIRIGSGFGGGRFFNGLIDEVAIYDRALSADRVLAHYEAARSAVSVPEPGSLLLTGAGLLLWSGKRRRARHRSRR